MFTGDVNSGVAGDIRQVTSVARRMVTEWGMNDRIGFVFYGEEEGGMQGFDLGGAKEFSEETQRAIDEEVKKLIDGLFDETQQLLNDNRDKVEAVARALIKHETLDATDIDHIMKGERVERPTVSDLLDQERDKTPTAPRRGTVIAPSDQDDPDVKVGAGPVPSPG